MKVPSNNYQEKGREIMAVASHIHREKGVDVMDSKTYQFGNTKVIVYSHLINMSREEQENWYNDQWEKKNPTLLRVAQVVEEIYQGR